MTHEEIRNLVQSIVRSRGISLDGTDFKKSIANFIVALKVDRRMYMITSETAKELWVMVREDPEVTDFVMGGSVELRLRCGKLTVWKALVEDLGYALSINNNTSTGDQCLVDKDLAGRISDRTTITRLLENNGWLVFLLLLEQMYTGLLPVDGGKPATDTP